MKKVKHAHYIARAKNKQERWKNNREENTRSLELNSLSKRVSGYLECRELFKRTSGLPRAS